MTRRKSAKPYEVRALLEGHKTRLAARRQDRQIIKRIEAVLNKGTAAVAARRFDHLFDLNQHFHGELAAAGQNTVLGDLLQRLRNAPRCCSRPWIRLGKPATGRSTSRPSCDHRGRRAQGRSACRRARDARRHGVPGRNQFQRRRPATSAGQAQTPVAARLRHRLRRCSENPRSRLPPQPGNAIGRRACFPAERSSRGRPEPKATSAS